MALGAALKLFVDVRSLLSVVSPNFLGVNIDSASLYQGTQPHRLNFSDASLTMLASRLGGSSQQGAAKTTLRIGGSAAEDLGFGAGSCQRIEVEEAYWNAIASFVDTADFSLSFDLNAGRHMRMRDAGENTWNSSNARKLLSHVASRPEQRQILGAVQLGNEPGHTLSGCNVSLLDDCYSAEDHGRDYIKLRELIRDIFGENGPHIQGPDVCLGLGNGPNASLQHGDKCANLEYLESLLVAAKGAIDEVTVHNYGLGGPVQGPGCIIEDFLKPHLWETGMRETLAKWRRVQRRAAPSARIILSETASTPNGGCPDMSNSFAAGFFWVHQLGLVASEAYWQVYRQDLVGFSGIAFGSSYALAGDAGWVGAPFDPAWPNRTSELTPNPDFFTSLLWKKLMGSKLLPLLLDGVNSEGETPVRIHAACTAEAPGDISIAYVNGEDGDMSVDVENLRASSRVEYVLTSGNGSLYSRQLRLNGGAPLSVDDDLKGAKIHGEVRQLRLPGQSYGFFTLRNVRAPVCADSHNLYV